MSAKKNNYIIYSLENINQVIEELYSLLSKCSVLAISGTLGAGKTTLVQKLLRRCGVMTDVISSPTFSYVSIYYNSLEQVFYHFDLYRICTLEDFYSMGFDEYIFASNSWSFVEWPDVIVPLLTKRSCFISIDYYEDNQRILTYQLSDDII